MKPERAVLIAISFLLLAIVGILSNVLAANFPSVPRPLLWLGSAVVILAFVAVNVFLAVLDAKQSRAKGPQPPHPTGSRKQYANQPPHSNNALEKQVQPGDAFSTPASLRSGTSSTPEEGQPTIEQPMLLCLAIDVSDSMKKPILDHTGKAIERWTSIQIAFEHFVHLGIAWVKDPETQQVLPLYHLMAYGFGFKETVRGLGSCHVL